MSEIHVGDTVSWPHVTHKGRTMTIRSWEGTVKHIDGVTVLIKRRGKIYGTHMKNVRRLDETSTLTEMVIQKRAVEPLMEG